MAGRHRQTYDEFLFSPPKTPTSKTSPWGFPPRKTNSISYLESRLKIGKRRGASRKASSSASMINGLKRLWSTVAGLRDSEGVHIIPPGPPAAAPDANRIIPTPFDPAAHSDTCRRVAPGTPATLVQFDLVLGALNVLFAGLYPPKKSVPQHPHKNKTSQFILKEGGK